MIDILLSFLIIGILFSIAGAVWFMEERRPRPPEPKRKQKRTQEPLDNGNPLD
jgi:hypothetical protein